MKWLIAVVLLASTPAWAQDREFSVNGYLRVRSDWFNDLDLNTGPTPSGQVYFPTAASNPNDKTLTAADMRLRLDPRLDLGLGVRIRGRVDVLDNVALGSTPDVLPANDEVPLSAGASVQNPPVDSVRVKRVWGEVTLPIGVLAAGRMGALVNWGTGMFVNNGDCLDCDFGDAGDRIFFQTSMLGHLWMVAYDLSAVGPGVQRFGQVIDLDASDDVRTIAFAVARWDDPAGIARTLAGGRTLVNYGLLVDYRWQDKDAPGWYRTPQQTTFGPDSYVTRNVRVGAFDFWGLVQSPSGLRVEAEVASLIGKIGNASPLPGAAFTNAINQTQLGGILRLDWRWLGLEFGYASGDKAPGFGVRTGIQAQAGDIDGGQARPPYDNTVDNFLFAKDYRIDLILWRRLIGRVTDAWYLRPHAEWWLGKRIALNGALIWSHAVFAESTPGNSTDLGVEIDVGARYIHDAGFETQLSYGALLPGDGLRVQSDMTYRSPSPAQTLHLILAYKF